MKVRLLFAFVAALLLAGSNAGQSAVPGQSVDAREKKPDEETTSTSSLKPGVVVESIEKNFDGDKAGLQPGDLLLRWSRGDAHGDLFSPFDLTQVQTEQSQSGPVTIEGFRGAEKKTWSLVQNQWRIKTRPD